MKMGISMFYMVYCAIYSEHSCAYLEWKLPSVFYVHPPKIVIDSWDPWWPGLSSNLPLFVFQMEDSVFQKFPLFVPASHKLFVHWTAFQLRDLIKRIKINQGRRNICGHGNFFLFLNFIHTKFKAAWFVHTMFKYVPAPQIKL